MQRVGQLREHGVQHLGLVGGDGEQFVGAAQHDLREHVDREDGVAGEQHVEDAGDGAVLLDVVRVHGQDAGDGEERPGERQVLVQLGVHGVDERGDETQLGERGGEGGEHVVPDAEHREARHGRRAAARLEDE